jgi:HAE1 family hydrophobic/amphiphilic exporter-1
MEKVLISGTGSSIEIKVFGKDINELKDITDEIAQEISSVEGMRDINTTLSKGKPEMVIKIDRERASQFGLTVGQIGSAVKNSAQGLWQLN